MSFFLFTLAVALTISLVWQLAKRKPFDLRSFIARVGLVWLIVTSVATLLFIAWVILAMGGLSVAAI
ncbi:MAG: hypothetical protein ACREEP_04690 [Dongiaceae bacterium]